MTPDYFHQIFLKYNHLILNETFVAAMVAFLGVFFTIRSERKRAREERIYLAKQQAFLNAAECVSRFLTYFSTLPDRDLPSGGLVQKEVADLGPALTNLHFFCRIETIQKAVDLNRILTKTFLDGLKSKIPSMSVAIELNVIENEIQFFSSMMEKAKQKMDGINIHEYPQLFELYRNQYDESFNRSKAAYKKQNGLIDEKSKAVESCRDIVLSNMKEVQNAVKEVLLMARKELSFKIDKNKYAHMLNESSDEMWKNMDTFIKEIRSVMNVGAKD